MVNAEAFNVYDAASILPAAALAINVTKRHHFLIRATDLQQPHAPSSSQKQHPKTPCARAATSLWLYAYGSFASLGEACRHGGHVWTTRMSSRGALGGCIALYRER